MSISLFSHVQITSVKKEKQTIKQTYFWNPESLSMKNEVTKNSYFHCASTCTKSQNQSENKQSHQYDKQTQNKAVCTWAERSN